MLDNLAQGRFDFGVGKGVRPGEFAKLRITYDYDQAAAMTRKRSEILPQSLDPGHGLPYRPVLELPGD